MKIWRKSNNFYVPTIDEWMFPVLVSRAGYWEASKESNHMIGVTEMPLDIQG